MPSRAAGTFDVKLAPLPPTDPSAEPGMTRMSIDKVFHGELEGVSTGEMMAVGTAVKGSAGYVAIERVSGTLQDRAGSFVLQHFGIANRGVNRLTLEVVPDSGTDQLTGLAGSMAIIINGGKHFYEFDYTVVDAPATPL